MFEIGNTLRESRLRRGLDISDCEGATKIRGKYLRALEEEQFDVLPGPTYIKGFLRTYSEYLELDGRLVVDEYEARFTKRVDHTASEDAARRRARRRRNREGRVLAIVAGIVMAASVAAWVVFADDPPPAPTAPAGQVTTTFSAVGPRAAYVEVHAGGPEGAELLNATLRPGTSREIATVPPVWVRVGDGAGLRIDFDGLPLTPPRGSTEFRILAGGELQTSVPR
jgi:hypothetical protein